MFIQTMLHRGIFTKLLSTTNSLAAATFEFRDARVEHPWVKSIAAGRALDSGPVPERALVAAADVREAGRNEETGIDDQRE